MWVNQVCFVPETGNQPTLAVGTGYHQVYNTVDSNSHVTLYANSVHCIRVFYVKTNVPIGAIV